MASSKQRSAALSPDKVAVIVCGYPSQAAQDVAKACKRRGYQVCPFGLATANEASMEVSGVGKITLVKFDDKEAKNKLQQAINEARKENRSVVVVDTTPNASEQHVALYNELKVPFIMQSKPGESHTKAVQDTQEANTFALISDQMNKRTAVFDQMWHDWSRRYPGLLDDGDFFFRSSHPQDTPPSLLDSLSDLVNKPFGLDQVQPFGPNDKVMEGHTTREYTFKNGSGTSTFTFRQAVNDNQEYADSIADSVGFLAQKSQEIARPQVYNMLDVAAYQPRLALSWW